MKFGKIKYLAMIGIIGFYGSLSGCQEERLVSANRDNGAIYTEQMEELFPARSAERNDVAFLKSGAQLLKSRIDLIRMAKAQIFLQTFIWDADESGILLAEELIQAHQRGVTVKVMVDAMMNYELASQALFARMRVAGIELTGFSPGYGLYTKVLNYHGRYIDYFLDNNYRNHEKLLAIDPYLPGQAYGIVGGSNIANPYFRINPKTYRDNWIDQDVIVRGDIVADISNLVTRNIEDYQREYPEEESTLDQLITFAQSFFSKTESSPAAMREIETILQSPHILDQVYWSPSSLRLVGNRPKQNERFIHDIHMEHINQASREIIIANVSFIPNNELLDALANATQRGVQIKLLTNSTDTGDVDTVVIASHMRIKDLFNHPQLDPNKVQVFEWAGDPRKQNGEGLNHSKFMIFDERTSIVGSYNIDPRSDNLNSESILIFDGAKATADLRDWFETCISNDYSDRITPEIAQQYADPTGVMEQLNHYFVSQIIPIL